MQIRLLLLRQSGNIFCLEKGIIGIQFIDMYYSVRSVLLYDTEVLSLNQEATVEKSQTQFFKTLYFLQSSTPGCVVRRESGLNKLIVDIVIGR